MSTKILGNEELNILRAKTPYSLPDNPSDKGFNARQIKTKFWEGYLLLFNWLKETQASLNNDFATTNSALLNESKRIDVILTYFSNGKANFAVRDRNNNIIDETYELKSEASTKFNQLIADIQSVSSASGNTITGTQNINADGIQYTITLNNTQNATLSTITQYLPLATTLKAGLLSSTDKEKINNIESDLTNFLANAKAYTDEKLQRDNIVNILGTASYTLEGLLTAEDKKKIDALYSLLGEAEDADTVVNTINEVLAIFSSYPEGVDIVSQLEKKVNYTDVINTLDSEETSKPLSAKMGKELKTEVDTKAELAYVNEELDKKALKSDILVIDEAVTAQESEITTTQSEGDKLVDEIVGYIDGSPRGVYASLSALQSAFPSGAQGVYVCSDNGHWYYYNNGWTDGGVYQANGIAEDSVSIIDTKFYEKNSLNLLDKSTITRGHYIYTDGSIRDNAGYFYTDYIEVIQSEPYFMSPSLTNNNFYAFYDSDKNFISGGFTTNDYLVMPATTKFIRLSMQLSILDYAYFSKFSTIKSGYIIDNNNIDNNATNLKISKGKYNLFDKNKICKGWYKYYLSGETTALASYCISDFIEITPSTTIYIQIPNQQMHISYFDENYSYVSGNLITDSSGTFVTPATAKYVILSFKWEYADTVMLSYSNINYRPYYTLDEVDKLLSSPIREKVIIKPDGVFNDIVDGFNYAFSKGNCDVYIEGVWELNDYLNKVDTNKGIRIGNNNHYFFASDSKITFTYTGSNTNISNVTSAFISMRGFGDFEMYNATIECSNVRYCVHDDNGGVSSSNLPLISYTHKYINCNMKLTRPNTPENTHCIGGGIGEDGYVVIDGCLFNSVNSQNGDVSFHGNWSFNAYSIASKFNMFITNCYFEHTLQLVSPDPETTPKNLLFANNSISESIILNDTDTTKWNIKQWNNEIRS